MRGIKSSLQRELDAFCKELEGGEFNIRGVTKGAFTQARAKLNPSAFVEMNDNIVGSFYSDAPYLSWRGHRLLACDGTRLVLPDHATVREEFGVHGFGPNGDSQKSMATASFLYDPLNFLVLDARIDAYSVGEGELLDRHLPKIGTNDLLLLDRGYPGVFLMLMLRHQKSDFCMRMSDQWLAARALKESGEKERTVTLSLADKDKSRVDGFPGMETQIKVRLVCLELETGEKEVLCTSLLDEKKYPHGCFAGLYHERWGVEEGFKLFKSRVEVENFSGKTANAVKQDFHAKVFMMSFMALMAFPIEELVRGETFGKEGVAPKKINRTSAYEMTRNISISLFLHRAVNSAVNAFTWLVYKTTELVRKGRKHERKHKKKKQYHMNYKPL